MVGFRSNTQLARMEQSQKSADQVQAEPEMVGVAHHIEKHWQAARSAKDRIRNQMLRALRMRTGVYEQQELSAIRQQGGSEIYMMLTAQKCRAAESWLREVLLPDVGRPWGLEPGPMPDLPPTVSQAVIKSVTQEAIQLGWDPNDRRIDDRVQAVKQEAYVRLKELAQKISERHELKIAEQLQEGKWDEALSDFIYDFVTFPAAIIKGPTLRKRKVREYIVGSNHQWFPQVRDVIRPEFSRRHPMDIYPSPGMRDIQNGNLIDRYRYTREDLQAMKGVPGYSDVSIDAVLRLYGERGYNKTWIDDLERATLELRPNEQYDPEGMIETLNYWGSCSGLKLLEWQDREKVDAGSKRDIQPNREYQIEGWKIGAFVIKCAINPDPLGMKPYHKASFDEIPGAFWGLGLPDIMGDTQRMCNGAARSIANNMSIASGPQVEINVDRLAEGEQVTKPYPWKLYQTTTDLTGNNQPAVRFWQPVSQVQELLLVYNHFERVAENVSGISNASYGNSQAGGAGRTASGMSMLMGNMSKGIRRLIKAIDMRVISGIIYALYDFNMEHDPDPTIKGDLRAVAKGSAALIASEQAQNQRQQLLASTLNPIDAQILGVKGRKELLRESIKASGLPVDKILPDDMETALRLAGMPPPHQLLGPQAGQAGQPQPQAGGAPGMEPEGGTPEAQPATDLAGNQPNGVAVRKQALGYRNGGVIKRPHHNLDVQD